MSETTTETREPCTEEQKVEWRELTDKIHEAREAYNAAQREAGSWLSWGIEHPESLEFAQMRAMQEARRAVDLWAQRAEVRAVQEAHPYTAELRARMVTL